MTAAEVPSGTSGESLAVVAAVLLPVTGGAGAAVTPGATAEGGSGGENTPVGGRGGAGGEEIPVVVGDGITPGTGPAVSVLVRVHVCVSPAPVTVKVAVALPSQTTLNCAYPVGIGPSLTWYVPGLSE